MKKILIPFVGFMMLAVAASAQPKAAEAKYGIIVQGVPLTGPDVTNAKNDHAKLNDNTDAKTVLVSKADSNYQKPGSYTTRYDFKNEVNTLDLYKIYKKLGTAIKPIFTLCPQIATTTVTPVDNRVCLTLMYAADTLTATGVKFSMNAAGAYTADQTNGFALFRISQDTAYKIAETANTATIWTTTAYSPTNIAFGTPVAVYPGFYAIGFIYNNAGQTTQPTFGGCQNQVLSTSQSLSYGWYLSMNFNTQNSFATFYKSSTYYSTNGIIPTFYIY